MRKTLLLLCILMLIGQFVLLKSAAAPELEVIRVPEDYWSLNDAVISATSGQTIVVNPGRYEGYVDVFKSVNLIANGTVTLYADAPDDPVVIKIHADNVSLSGFTLNCMDDNIGVKTWNGSNVRIENLTVHEPAGIGICLVNSTNCVVRNNVLIADKKTDGLLLCNSNSSVLDNNTLSGFSNSAISAYYAANMTICNNTITLPENGHYGIYSVYSSGSIRNNTINPRNCSCYPTGIQVITGPQQQTTPCNDSEILSIEVTENTINEMDTGIDIYNPSLPCAPYTPFPCLETVTLTFNTITNCTYGLTINNADRNNITRNNFITNHLQAALSRNASATWEYNYWSDYTGEDLNADNIGDTAYIIDENNQDPHPLMTDPHPNDPPITIIKSGHYTWTGINRMCFRKQFWLIF